MKIASVSCAIIGSLTVLYADDPAPMPECALDVVEQLDEEKVQIKTEAIPKEYAEEKKAAIKLEHLKRDAEGNYIATFRIINPEKKRLSYYMYPSGMPKTDSQILKDGKWIDPDMRLISAPFQQFTVGVGQSLVFEDSVNGTDMPARIGISCWDPDDGAHKRFTIWSDPIER